MTTIYDDRAETSHDVFQGPGWNPRLRALAKMCDSVADVAGPRRVVKNLRIQNDGMTRWLPTMFTVLETLWLILNMK